MPQKEISFSIDQVKTQNKNQCLIQDIEQKQLDKNDLALIQCFWGLDQKRILACNIMLDKMLSCEAKPKDWIFVEAQAKKTDAIFGWVKKIGIKYIFKKISKESEGIFLKMPLWNIGASQTECQKLCFVDSDVYFENKNWLFDVDQLLGEKFDVMQLHKTCKYDNTQHEVESLAYSVMSNSNQLGFKVGHGGHTLGITRKAYNEIGKFDAVNSLDDQWFWMKIFGRRAGFNQLFKLPYDPTGILEDGYPLNVGATEDTCIHICHEQCLEYYNACHNASYGHFKPMLDIDYDRSQNSLPTWANNNYGKLMRNCFKRVNSGDYSKNIYFEEYSKIFGKIDTQHPLVVATIWKKDYVHRSKDCVLNHKMQFDQNCKSDFIYVCFCNEQIDGVDCIPFDKNLELTSENIIKILFSKKVEYPKNATVMYSSLDDKFSYKFEAYCMPQLKPMPSTRIECFEN